MSNDPDKDLLARLAEESPGRRLARMPGSRWGRLVLPPKEEASGEGSGRFRILFIGSWTLGLLAFDALASMAPPQSDEISLVGVVTDDPLDAEAKISVKKRFWRYYREEEREKYEGALLNRALALRIPCYTGDVKNETFRTILERLAPDAIVVAAFGQVIDESIINFPRYGIYNVHPSDLLHAYGAGPQPWEDLIERKAATTRVTIHHVSTGIDSGAVVGQSPDINVLLGDGSPSDDVLLVGEKTLVPVREMVRQLAAALIAKKAGGLPGPLESLDFGAVLSPELKARLTEPLDPLKRRHVLPFASGEEEFTV